MARTQSQSLRLDIPFEQLLSALLELPVADQLRIADKLRAAVAAEKWRILSARLPDTSSINMDEIVAEVKSVRRARQDM